MNLVIITGHVLDLKNFSRFKRSGEVGKTTYDFLVLTNGQISNSLNKIPIRAVDDQALICYANLTTNSYVEIVGELVRPTADKFYVHLRSITYKAPKTVRQYYIKSTDFIETYKPSKLIESMVTQEEMNKKGLTRYGKSKEKTQTTSD